MNDVFLRTRWIGVWLALSINRYLCLVLTHISARSLKFGYTYVIRLRKIIARHTKYRHTSASITDITYGHSPHTTTRRLLVCLVRQVLSVCRMWRPDPSLVLTKVCRMWRCCFLASFVAINSLFLLDGHLFLCKSAVRDCWFKPTAPAMHQ
jgi:hypothetical protein